MAPLWVSAMISSIGRKGRGGNIYISDKWPVVVGASGIEKKSDTEYIPVTPVEYRPIADMPGSMQVAYKQCSDCR
ncbi:hypothetical protein MUK42_03473 [Musa troglodytarum]|uniref:Uncharacterized protein n=1 Tax=Musa troglodytarum TaxID=320322 RepID=A0A9E7KJY3_9LILI|nr:hypothetical protein MUK42_03473 [Musa troglodytarum]